MQIQKMNYVNVSSRNLQSHKGASWALRSIVRLCLGKRQHQIMSGSHVPHVCKYVGETSVGKGLEWKIMLSVSTLVMVEVTKKKKHKNLMPINYSHPAAASCVSLTLSFWEKKRQTFS